MSSDLINNEPSAMIQLALENGTDLDKLRGLLDLQRDWQAGEAKKVYTIAMAKFKENPPVVTKDKLNKQYNSMYTSLNNLVNTVNPKLSEQGLSASWDIDQTGDKIKVTCKLTHKQGHTETATMAALPDGSGSKNGIQQIKSTITYLKAVTFESIIGLASSDSNEDDDGNSSGVDIISKDELSKIMDIVDNNPVDLPKFKQYFKIDKLQNLPKKSYKEAFEMLNEKYGEK